MKDRKYCGDWEEDKREVSGGFFVFGLLLGQEAS